MAGSDVKISANEAKLSGYERVDHDSQRYKEIPKYTITISRQFGCDALAIAEEVKRIMEERTKEEWNVFHQELTRRVGEVSKIPVDFLQHLGDSTHILDKIAAFIPNLQTHNDAYQFFKEEIMKVAKQGNAIIIGRGGSILTEKLANCLHFRLEASMDFRVDSFAKRYELSQEKAFKLVKENQVNREKFIEECLGEKECDNFHYDAIFNRDRSSSEIISESICTYVLLSRQACANKLKQKKSA